MPSSRLLKSVNLRAVQALPLGDAVVVVCSRVPFTALCCDVSKGPDGGGRVQQDDEILLLGTPQVYGVGETAAFVDGVAWSQGSTFLRVAGGGCAQETPVVNVPYRIPKKDLPQSSGSSISC